MHSKYKNIIFDFGDVLVYNLDESYNNIAPYEYVIPLLEKLSNIPGVNLYYLSNWWQDFEIFASQGVFDFMKYFKGGIVSYRVGCEKPSKKIYELLIDTYGINPSESIFFDDKVQNIEAAKMLGFNTVKVDENVRNKFAAYASTALSEANNDPSYSMYFISDSYMGDKTINPSIPKDSYTKKGIRNNEVERVVFYPSINNAIIASDNINSNREMFVHVPVEGQTVKAIKPSDKQAADKSNTGEIWVKEPIKVKCIGKIRIGKSLKDYKFTFEDKEYTQHSWNYSWLTRQDKHTVSDNTVKKGDTSNINKIKSDFSKTEYNREKQEEEHDKDFRESVTESLDILTEALSSELPDTLNTSDKLIFFGEDAKYDAQLKRLLYSSRIKQRKEVIAIYDQVKADNKWIKYTFPELNRYAKRNIFVDTYYYMQTFFANNTWLLKKGMNLFFEFLTRVINNPKIKENGYDNKVIMIPILDWESNPNNIWDYRKSLNPISIIYQYLFTGNLQSLKKVFGDTDVLFVGTKNYFKINFNQLENKDSKKYATKFKLFILKIVRNEEFDPEDVDTTADNADDKEVIKNKIVDKIEDAKGVDLTADIENSKKKISKENKAKSNPATKTTKIPSSKTTKKEVDNKTPDGNPISKATVNKPDKEKSSINQNNINKEKLADTIAVALDKDDLDAKTVDDVMDVIDSDAIAKNALLKLEPDENVVNITDGRAVRMSKLDKKVLETSIKGKTVKEILEDPSNTVEIKTELPISDPLDEFKELTYVNFDKNYNVDKDIIRCFRHFAHTSIPVSVKNIEVKDNSTSEDRVELYRVEMEDYRGIRFTIKLDIPVMKDNRFLLRGNVKSISTQLYTMPILKVDLDSCQVVSNYSKIIMGRFKSGGGRSLPATAKLLKAIDKYNGSEIKFIKGDNTKVCNKYDLPLDYIDLASSLSRIETKDVIFYFNQDELRNTYEVSNEGIPIGYNKKLKSVIYLDDNLNAVDVIVSWLFNINDSFVDLFNSATRPSVCTYTRAKIMSSQIPLAVICGYHEGLRSCMDKGAINYHIVDKLDKDTRLDVNKDWIKFSDGYIVYEADQAASLFMNGLKDCDTEDHTLAEMDDKNMYLEFLDNFGGRIKADGLDNFYNLMIDPMTEDSLKFYHLPTDYVQVLMYANSLLADNKYIKHTETATKRFRRGQLIAVYTYKVLSSAYSGYANQVKHGSNTASMQVKQSDVIDMFLTDSITSDDSVINALRDIETTNQVTTKGPSGMNSARAYSLDKRTYDDSMLNVFGISTGFASNVGITRQATLNANVTPEGYTKVIDGDTSKMNTSSTLTATEAVTPFGTTHDDSMRTAMTFIQTAKHQVRTVESDPMLVTNGADEALPYMSTDRFAFKAKQDGKILEVNDNYILIEYKDGTKDYVSLIETIEKNSDGGYFVPLKLSINEGIKVGKKIKANDIIAYDTESYSSSLGESGNLAYNVGKLAKVAIINSDEGFEDSGIISESMAKKMATRVDYQYPVTLDKNSIVYNICKVGQHVEVGDSLITWVKPFEDEDANSIMKSLGSNQDSVSELGKSILRAEVTGVVKSIKIFRTVEIDELSDSLKKIVNNYERPLKQMEKVLKENNLDTSQIPAHYKLDTTGKLKKAEDSVYIEFYVEYLDSIGVGDKISLYSANKAVEKAIIPNEVAPYTDFRPNEKIDVFCSETSINHRKVASTLVAGSLTKLMVELDRSVKDIMGISYDDSTL